MTKRAFCLLFLLACCGLAAPGHAGPMARLDPGQPLSRDLVEGLLGDALAETSPGERFAIELAAPALPLANPATTALDLSLADVRLEPRTERLLASLVMQRPGSPAATLPLAGRARRLVEVPVLGRPIPRGGVIAAADVETVWLAAATLPTDAARDAQSLIGREARRALPAERIIRSLDLAERQLVARGQAVSMIFAGQGIELSSLGQALDNGALGEMVRVVNADSSTVRRGIVSGPREVRFAKPGNNVP